MKRVSMLLIVLLVSTLSVWACTTAVITGRASKDGRPMLFKQRDTGFLENKMMYFEDGKYTYMGIVNTDDVEGKEVWGGYNSAGFAIMNSASYNLNDNEYAGKPELEGEVMKLALQSCATVEDFERLLDSLPRPMNLSANFGAIDAKGGAAYYETGDFGYVKFDANDAEIGYIVRSNSSESGDSDRDMGLSRCEVGCMLFAKAYDRGELSPRTIFQEVSRSLQHGIVKVDLYDLVQSNTTEPYFVPFRDYIPRYSTASSMVVQGVKSDESTDLTVMWTLLGSPLSSVAMPLFLPKAGEGGRLPQIVVADEDGKAPICTKSLELKLKLFPITRGEGKDYLDLNQLIRKDGTGILQGMLKLERDVFTHSEKEIEQWCKAKKRGDTEALYKWLDSYITEGMDLIR